MYRVFLSPLQHIGLVHITMNMMSYLPMATTLERKVGSFQFFYASLLFTVINGMLHVTISELFHLNSCRFAIIDIFLAFLFLNNEVSTRSQHTFHGSVDSAGLSGVIFSILVVDVSSSMEPTQNVLGLFNVPTAAYPWVLLVMMSLMMPNVSFVGHLCGIVSGYLCKSSFLEEEDRSNSFYFEFADHRCSWSSLLDHPVKRKGRCN